MNTTITVTTQKRREIGVLTALGSRQDQIIGIFVSQAAFVGILGTLLGLVLSGLVLQFRDDIRMGIAVLSGGSANADSGMFLATIPAQIEPWFIVVTCLGSILFCLLAALPPPGWRQGWTLRWRCGIDRPPTRTRPRFHHFTLPQTSRTHPNSRHLTHLQNSPSQTNDRGRVGVGGRVGFHSQP